MIGKACLVCLGSQYEAKAKNECGPGGSVRADMMCRTCYKCNTVPGMQGCKRQLCQKHSVAIFKSDWLQATVTEHIREDFSYMAFLTSFLIRLMVCPPTVLSQKPAHHTIQRYPMPSCAWDGLAADAMREILCQEHPIALLNYP